MQSRFLFLLFMLFPCLSHLKGESNIGKPFPHIYVESLSGQAREFPGKTGELILIGFEKDCVPMLKGWVEVLTRQKLLSKNVEIYTLSVLGTSWKARVFRPLTIRMIKSKVPVQGHGRTFLLTQNQEVMETFFGGGNNKVLPEAYLVLIDKKGIVRWQHTGAVTEAAKSTLRTAANNL